MFFLFFNPLYPKVLQALKSFPNFVAVYSTVEQVGLVIPGLVWVGPSLSTCLLSICPSRRRNGPPLPRAAAAASPGCPGRPAWLSPWRKGPSECP